MAARPWENRIFDNYATSKDVNDSHLIKGTDTNIPGNSKEAEPHQKPENGYTRRKSLVPPVPLRKSCETRASTKGLHSKGPHASGLLSKGSNGTSHQNIQRTGSQPKVSPSLSNIKQTRPVSPKGNARREDLDEGASVISTTARSTSSMPAANPQFGTRYSNCGPVRDGSIRDDESLESFAGYVPSYMQATQSMRNKARSRSLPKQRPDAPEKDFKKRLSFPISEDVMSNTGISTRPFKPSARPQKGHSGRRFSGSIESNVEN
jgi:hypothetical protein